MTLKNLFICFTVNEYAIAGEKSVIALFFLKGSREADGSLMVIATDAVDCILNGCEV